MHPFSKSVHFWGCDFLPHLALNQPIYVKLHLPFITGFDFLLKWDKTVSKEKLKTTKITGLIWQWFRRFQQWHIIPEIKDC